jgi:nucleotide-binding universal stress UspA family protein
MDQLKRIVVGHDLREGGEVALKSGIVLAGKCDATLRLVHVVEPHQFYRQISHPLASQYGREKIAEQAGAKLEEVATSQQLGQLRVEYEVRTGKPFVELILAGRAWQTNLIIIGGPSRRQGHLLGSTGERVMRKAPVPVLVARKPLSAKAKRFLVPSDFSPGAAKAAEEALALAASFGASIFFLHVVDPTPLYLYGDEDTIGPSLLIPQLVPEDIEEDWRSFLSTLSLGKIAWENRTEEGRPVNKILEYAGAIEADAIIMGTHGKSGLVHMLLGSVAEEVARAAPCPVLTIRPEAFQFELP